MEICAECGSSKYLNKVKHLALPGGRNGHITLSEWTYYCTPCIRDEVTSKRISNIIDNAKTIRGQIKSK